MIIDLHEKNRKICMLEEEVLSTACPNSSAAFSTPILERVLSLARRQGYIYEGMDYVIIRLFEEEKCTKDKYKDVFETTVIFLYNTRTGERAVCCRMDIDHLSRKGYSVYSYNPGTDI